MSATLGHTTEIAMKLRLTEEAKRKLEERAAESGRDMAEYTSELIERVITRPMIDEILAPVRKQAAESGMSEEELMNFGRDLLKKVRAERKSEPVVTDRAVYDTMIFFQWAVLPQERQHRTIKALYEGAIRLCLSPMLVDEIWDVFTRPELRERFPELTMDRAQSVMEQAEMLADWFDSVPQVFTWPQHPDDDHLFNLAIHAHARYLVTWETRLLDLPASSVAAAKLLRELAPDLSIITPKGLAEILKAPPSDAQTPAE